MTDANTEKSKLLEEFSKPFDELRSIDYLIGGSLYLQTSDLDRYLLVKPVLTFGVYKITVKEVSSRGEGSGVYFELHDTTGVTTYVSRQLDRILEKAATISPELRKKLESQKAELSWNLTSYHDSILK